MTGDPAPAPVPGPAAARADSGCPDPGPWAQALLAARLLAVDPAGLGGVVLRGRAGPVRDAWLAGLKALLPPGTPWRRAPLHGDDGALLGGLDLTATLSAGRPVAARGLLAEADGGVVVLAGAERLTPSTAARLTAVLDTGLVTACREGLSTRLPARLALIALDESDRADARQDGAEGTPPALADRLALHLDLETIGWREATAPSPPDSLASAGEAAAARQRLPGLDCPADLLNALVATSFALGIDSLRAPWFALRVARAAAALAGRDRVAAEDAALAARLVLAPRATRLPGPAEPEGAEPAEVEQSPPGPDQPAPDDPDAAGRPDEPVADRVLAAATAAIPPGLLALLQAGTRPGRSAGQPGRAGASAGQAARGRPAGSRRGTPGRNRRLDLISCLRAAAPWQPLRRARRPGAEPGRLCLTPEDLRIRRLKPRARTTTIFLVDASGSAAIQRLAEAKGAVELLLADCYVRRDQVALLAFRGSGADLLLPPTRSLTRARRCLAALPGGGGTPLAAGIGQALDLALALRRGGSLPALVLLTDGRANVARDGAKGRAQAAADALAVARQVRACGLPALLLDTAPLPEPAARTVAEAMGAAYRPLPVADAAAVSTLVRATLPAARGR